MKNLFLILFTTLLVNQVSFAEDKMSPWPRVIAWSHGVDLTINNFTDDDYSCSGPIYIRYASGARDTEYYYGRIYARQTEYRMFYSRRSQDRITSAFDSIFCHRL